MRIYPAIDIKDGKCVRLLRGSFSDMTVYGDSPVDMARKWESEGGEFIHVVDLDGARSGSGANSDIIRDICAAVKVPVQTGGGIRSGEDIERKLGCGVSRVIIGTRAVADRAFVKDAVKEYGDRIVIGIDARDGMVATDGWEKTSGITALDFAREMKGMGVKTVVYTDIATDGTLMGPNVRAMTEMAAIGGLDVIASGGIGSLAHILSLAGTGVEGVIVGRALYTGDVNLREAVKAVCE